MSNVQWIGFVSSLASALGLLLLAWQLWLTRKVLKAQVRAVEIQAYTSLNLEFLEIISPFREDINQPDIREKHLRPDEKRSIDRYFYLANMEYVLYKEGVVDKAIAAHWIRGMKGAAKRSAFVDRWNSTCSKFSLDDDFRAFFHEQITKEEPGERLAEKEEERTKRRHPITMENSREETIKRMRSFPERAAKFRETIRALREENSR